MSRLLDNRAIKIIMVIAMYFSMFVLGGRAVGDGEFTLGVIIVTMLGWGIFTVVKGEFNQKADSSVNNLEEIDLARRYQRNNIGKMYKNVALFMVPLIILSYIAVSRYIIHKDYTERMNNNFSVAIEQIKNNDNTLGVVFGNIQEDPLASIVFKESNKKYAVITGSLLLDTAKNIGAAFTSLDIAEEIDSGELVVTEENKAELIEQLKEKNNQIDKVYNNLMYMENSGYDMDNVILNFVSMSKYFKELNSSVIEGLENGMDGEKIYGKHMAEFKKGIEKDAKLTIKAIKDNIEKNKIQMVLETMALRLVWFTAILSIFRLIGIIKYFVSLKKYQRSYVTKE